MTSTSRVYPRVCGGTQPIQVLIDISRGLSPRVRGNLLRSSIKHPAGRSIPACAGNPWRWTSGCAPTRSIPACAGEPEKSAASINSQVVYPRVCGGTVDGGLATVPRPGLSPRVRGNPAVSSGDRAASRSIPACAGEPFRVSITGSTKPVYPRVCGGTTLMSGCARTVQGLSPRVRGNRALHAGAQADDRSIPACAGEPHALRPRVLQWRVYPRVCGGTPSTSPAGPRLIGLSPRVRGNLRGGGIPPPGGRSIPACAGEPLPAFITCQPVRVYPRVCGGTIPIASSPCQCHGLSPRVRGNRQRQPAAGNDIGSIPACAGEPLQPPPFGRPSGVYPRVCGGTLPALCRAGRPAGLSPRVRGNRGAKGG